MINNQKHQVNNRERVNFLQSLWISLIVNADEVYAVEHAKFFNLYGPTEATGMSCYWAAERELEVDEPIPVGGPFDNTRILLINEQGKRAEQGEVGELCVKGPGVMQCYYKNPEETAKVFTEDGWFCTGDVGYIDEDGYIHITGRLKSVIVLENGKNVFPEEIEEYLGNIETIAECAVIGRQNGSEVNLTALIYPAYLIDGDKSLNLAPEFKITETTAPTFTVQTQDDGIQCENAIAWFLNLKKFNRPCELHVFAEGGHGYGLLRRGFPVNDWYLAAENWFRRQK